MLWGYKFIPTKANFAVEDSLSKLLPPTLISNALQAFLWGSAEVFLPQTYNEIEIPKFQGFWVLLQL